MVPCDNPVGKLCSVDLHDPLLAEDQILSEHVFLCLCYTPLCVFNAHNEKVKTKVKQGIFYPGEQCHACGTSEWL